MTEPTNNDTREYILVVSSEFIAFLLGTIVGVILTTLTTVLY